MHKARSMKQRRIVTMKASLRQAKLIWAMSLSEANYCLDCSVCPLQYGLSSVESSYLT